MANEFEKHIGMQPNDPDKSSTLSGAKDKVTETAGQARDAVRENPGTFTSVALMVGAVGFALGWLCGQSSARSERHWH